MSSRSSSSWNYENTARGALNRWVHGLNATLEGRPFTQYSALSGVLRQIFSTWERSLQIALGTQDLAAYLAEQEPEGESSTPKTERVTHKTVRQRVEERDALLRQLESLDEKVIQEELDRLEQILVEIRDLLSANWGYQIELVDLEGAVEALQKQVDGDMPGSMVDADIELLRLRARCLELAVELQN